MATPLISEIMPWPGPWAPRAWGFCQGQLLAISTNDALFSLIGTIYGGDGRTTFALPDLRGRMAVGHGQGPGLSPYPLGGRAGQEAVTLSILEMPVHSHSATVTGGGNDIMIGGYEATQAELGTGETSPTDHTVASAAFGSGISATPVQAFSDASPNTSLGGLTAGNAMVTVGNAGGSQSHENRMPFQVINFCIALYGIYPSRS
jgi:microcystin-dependent protein